MNTWEITNGDLFLPAVSSTFHGCDLFSPVGARLPGGLDPALVGPAVDVASLTDLKSPKATVRDAGLDTAVVFIDRFGNARLAGQPADLAAAAGPLTPGRRLRMSVGDRQHDVSRQTTFGEVEPGAASVYDDADYAGLAIAVNQASAAERFGLDLDMPVRIEPA